MSSLSEWKSKFAEFRYFHAAMLSFDISMEAVSLKNEFVVYNLNTCRESENVTSFSIFREK